MDPLMPPPIRRIALDREPTVAPAARARRAERRAAAPSPQRIARPPVAVTRERMSVDGVWLAYGENWVVRDVSLPVRQGEVLALIGASGSGKTTLLRSLNRLTEITDGAARAGRITLDGTDIHDLEVNDLRRRVSMVFQQPNPFPMSIYDNVAYSLAEQRPERGRRRRRRSAELEPRRRGRAAARRAPRRGRGRSRPLGAAPVGRAAAAPVHRARARGRPRGPAPRRAVLGARPDLHGDDRGADHRAARERRRGDRHAQPAAGVPRRRPRRVHAPRRARRVRPQRAGLRPPARAAHPRLRQRGVRLRRGARLAAALALAALAAAAAERLRDDAGKERAARKDRAEEGGEPAARGERPEDRRAEPPASRCSTRSRCTRSEGTRGRGQAAQPLGEGAVAWCRC